MHVYRNRRYEEEIVMLIWHTKGEQRMIETHKQKTRIQAHHKITDSATQTHTQRNKQKTTCTGYDTGGDRPPGRSWLKAFCPGPRRRMWGYHLSCYQARSAQQRPWQWQQRSVPGNVKIESRSSSQRQT
jgi:hypothetical protein